jgi:23S rRNA pseudouridine1911/1915/1917 synthase
VATWLHGRIKDEVLLDQDKNSLNNRAGIVHRLDRATSGVMICAKTPKALSWLQKQFAERKTKKTYAAVVTGHLNPPEAIIDMPIGRNPRAPATFRVDAQGKSAVTHYKTVSQGDKYSLVELKPTTGRTHQLRVHLGHLGHPIVGDQMYGGEPAERLFLHAEELEITIQKDSERKVFTAPMPPEFKAKVAT